MKTTMQPQESGSTAKGVNVGDKGAVLLMLYNAAIELLEEAKISIERGDVFEKGEHLSQAHTIISELLASLDVEIGGEMARNLEALYIFMLDQVFTANLNNDTKPLDVVISLLRPLYRAWEEAITAERERVAQEYNRRSEVAA
jgi:flagellar protein FliS